MIKTIACLALFAVGTTTAQADSWPTHLHDDQRTGQSTESLRLPLRLLWSHRLPRPEPAWPPPAKQDYWNRKTNLQPRVVHDRANGIVVADGRLLVGSSSDDQVRALNSENGELLWRSFAEAPVRLAPTVWQDLVVFAADDGYVYGVEAASGKRRWRTRPREIGTRRIPGNGRIISERPIRSGVMIDAQGTGHFAAGIFPQQGAFFYSIDVRTGRILDRQQIDKSIQGYLRRKGGRIFAPTGRDPQGVLIGSGEAGAARASRSQSSAAFARISDAAHVFLGQENKVVAQDHDEEVWTSAVHGRVYAMAIAEGRLYASTDEGWIYAFGSGAAVSPSRDATPHVASGGSGSEDGGGETPHRHTKGYALYVAPGQAELEQAIQRAKNTSLQIVLAFDDEERAGRLRKELLEVELLGQVAVHVHDSLGDLPYADGIFRDVVGLGCERAERLLSPYAIASECLPRKKRDAASWTHAYGDAGNRASSGAHVGGTAMKLQWFGGPGPRHMVDRHMRTMPPLVSQGKMYLPGLDRVVTVDAFNGNVLWERQIPSSTRIGILKDCGWMAASGDALFVAVEARLLQFNTATEATPVTRVFANVPTAEREWGYLAVSQERILGSTTLPGSHRKTIDREAILEGAYSDNRPIVCSDGVFAFHRGAETEQSAREQPEWSYRSSGAILNPTLAANSDRIFFVENEMEHLSDVPTGRLALERFLSHPSRVVALDLSDGNEAWHVNLPRVESPQNAFLLCDQDWVVLVVSYNAATVHYDVRVYRAKDGMVAWSTTQDNKRKPGGDHGEQDKHPVMLANRLFVEPYAYDLDTGSRITEVDLTKRGYGCGTISASAEALFFRSRNPARYSLSTNQIAPVTLVTRPGCWINMIPAEGMLLIPEGSSGCTCNFPVQTSMALVPE